MRFVVFLVLKLLGCVREVVPIIATFSPKEPVSLLLLFMPILGNSLKMLIVAA